MKEPQDVTALVIDRGTFWPVAQRLARGFKKVYYHKPNGEDFVTFAQACRGDGHPDVELIDDSFWRIKDQIDVVVFPDCSDAGLQFEFKSQGKPVWGSKDACDYETLRGKWMNACEKYDLPLPKTHRLVGTTNLKLFLDDHAGEKFFVKISRFRGDMETFPAEDPLEIQNKIDELNRKFGPWREDIPFFVQEELKTEIEGGSDTYFCGGRFPSKIVLGYEKKGESYFATWKDAADMPPEIWAVNEKIAPLLAELDYCNMCSSEVRVADGESFWLDPCFRFPSPAGEEELELYKNFPEIVWNGANGIMTEPEMAAKYCGEAVITYTGPKDGWKSLKVPEEVAPFVKLYACGLRDGYSIFPPSQDPEAVGCAIALADTPQGVLDGLKNIAEALKNAPVSLHIEPIADLFKEIEEAEKQGIDFGKHELPEPAEVIES
jgi:hypothetical protein